MVITAALILTFLLRLLLVALFLPFSALDKILDFDGAVRQGQQLLKSRRLAELLIFAGLAVEIIAPLGILTGIADRAAALVLALYCMATAILFKEFWLAGDFWQRGASQDRNMFWDFLKNFSLAGGILLLTFGTGPVTIRDFFNHPLGSTHPYASHSPGAPK